MMDNHYKSNRKAVGRFEKKIEKNRIVSEMSETITKALKEKRNV